MAVYHIVTVKKKFKKPQFLLPRPHSLGFPCWKSHFSQAGDLHMNILCCHDAGLTDMEFWSSVLIGHPLGGTHWSEQHCLMIKHRIWLRRWWCIMLSIFNYFITIFHSKRKNPSFLTACSKCIFNLNSLDGSLQCCRSV